MKEMTRHYPVVVICEGKKFWAYVPDLPGVYGLGQTALKARKSLEESIRLYIEDCRADGDTVPQSAARIVSVSEIAVTA